MNEKIRLVIDGAEYKTYEYPCIFDELINDFIKAKYEKEHHKHVGILLNEETDIIWLLSLVGKEIKVYEDALVGKCCYPVNVKELSNAISKIIKHYINEGYKYIQVRKNFL